MKWYKISIIGWLVVITYSGSLFAATINEHFIFAHRTPISVGFISIALTILLFFVLIKKIKIFFHNKEVGVLKSKNGFSLIELLIVISIIGILSSNILPLFVKVRQKAYETKARAEFASLYESIQLYIDDYGDYPPDADRDVPPGLETYLAPGIWPTAAWPGSVFDWDNWDDPSTDEKIYQISVRFCPVGGSISTCHFPNQSWAEDFDQSSAVYYCIEGPCRSHITKPINHPGYCINCNNT